MKKFFKILGRILAGILILALLLVIVLAVIPLTERVPKAAAAGAGDWMAALPDERAVSEIVIPGTHDCASQNAQLGFITKCQALDIAQQLNIGARYLDIRLGAVDGALKLYHGFTKCKTSPLPWAAQLDLEDVLRDCYAFLDAHPGETILFAVKQEHGGLPDAEFDALVQGYVQQNPERWLTPDAIPTLGEARGRLVLLRRYEGAGLSLLWENQNGHDDVSRNTVAEENGSYTLWVQDRYEYGAADKWAAFLAGLGAAQTDGENAAVHFLSTKGTLPQGHPWHFARKLNAQLLALDAEQLNGWIVVDFLTPELAQAIYGANK